MRLRLERRPFGSLLISQVELEERPRAVVWLRGPWIFWKLDLPLSRLSRYELRRLRRQPDVWSWKMQREDELKNPPRWTS